MKKRQPVWDKIYREYLGSNKKYATIGGDLHPFFVRFIKNHRFKKKSVLDIGCGEGRYLKYLKDRGWRIAGIDSSKRVVAEARQLTGESKTIRAVDMYRARMPSAQYDLVVSVAAIHHGTKKQVRALITRIHWILMPGGRTFITVPALTHGGKWHRPWKPIVQGTVVHQFGPEKGLIHSFFTKKEVVEMFKEFRSVKMPQDHKHRFVVMAQK